jgi:acetyl esterase
MTNSATLDPGAQRILDILAEAAEKGAPALHEVTPAQARQMNLRSKELFGSDGPALSCQAINFPGPAGNILGRLYRPGEGTLPIIVYYHGGGWVVGSLDTHDGLCRHLASRSGAAVFSVDYRLAPEHVFPAAVDDAYAALEWTAENAGALGLDPDAIIVAGDSAGGNLAAVVALMARESAGPPIALQALLYPGTDMHMRGESHRLFTEHLLTPEAMRWFREHYLSRESDRDDWRASPLCAERFDALPPAYVMTAGFDPLRDEGKAYADRLEAAGVPVTYRCFEGQIHGFLTLDKVIAQALEAVDDVAAAIKRVAPRAPQ